MNEFERKAQSVTQRALPDRGSVLMFTKALSSVTGQSAMKGKPLTNSVTTRPSSSSAAHSNHTTPTNTSNTTGASTKRVAKMNTKVSKPQLDFQDQLPITAHFPKTLSEKTPIIRNSGPIDLTDDVDESHAKESVLDDIGGILHTKPTINSIEDDDDAFQQPKQRKVHPAKGKSGLPNPLANRKNAAAVRIEVKRSSPEVVIQLESDGESEKKEFVAKDAPKKANMDSDSSATLTIQLPESEAKIVLPVRHDFSAATPIEEPWLVDLFSQTLDLFSNSTNPLIPHLIQTFFSPEALAHRRERHHLLASSHAITKLSDFDHTVITQYVSLFTTTDSTFDETVFHSAVIIALSAILALDPTRIYAAWKERDGLVDVESEHVIVDVAQGYLYAATRDDREASEEVEGLRYFERLWGGEGCALEEEMKVCGVKVVTGVASVERRFLGEGERVVGEAVRGVYEVLGPRLGEEEEEGCICDADAACSGASDGCMCCGSKVPSFQHGVLRDCVVGHVVTCGDACSCGGGECVNRVGGVKESVRKGLELRVTRGAGVGLFTARDIMHGRFIGEVAGVVVGVHGVAVRRMVEKARGDGERDLWIVKWKGDEVFGIDTTYSCNYTRFINHSCKPNLRAILVFQRSKVKSPPRIAFFALHTIKAGSELTVDYGDVDVPGFEYTGMCKCNVIGKEGGKVTCKRAPVRNGKRKWVEEIEDDVQVGKKKGKGLTKKK